MRCLPDVFKLDTSWNDSALYAEEIWPRMNPHLSKAKYVSQDKMMYKKPEPIRLKEVFMEGKWDYLDKEFEAMKKAIADAADREMKRRQNELINKEYCMDCSNNVKMRIEYEKMVAPYNKSSEVKKKNPVFLRIDIKNVIFNPPATIVFWTDNTKTVVKAQDGEEYDPEKGLTMAICKKVYGNEGNYFNKIKKWTEPAYEELEEQERFENALKEFFDNMIGCGVAKKHEEVKKGPIIPLKNKEICKHCMKGYPHGDCSHLEPGCMYYDMFEPIRTDT